MTTSIAPDQPATKSYQRHGHEHRWSVLVVVAIAQLMVVLDATIVNIALPSAQRSLAFADTDRQWIVTAYALSFGSLLLFGGKLGDLFGRKYAFIIGLAGFAAASAVGGASVNFGMLVTARAAQGAFGALLAPAALSTLATTFTDPKERGKAFAVFGAVAGSGSAVGLVLGGMLTEWLSWRWCLYVNLVFAAAAIVGASVFLQNAKPPTRPRLDVPGTVLATAGLFCLVFGFARAATDGWGDASTLIFIGAGVVLMAAFLTLQSRIDNPLLPLHIVASRLRGPAYLSVAFSSISVFGVFLFVTFYLQTTKSFSPIENGVGFLPMTACIIATSTTTNTKLMPRFGPRLLITFGMLLGALSVALFLRLSVTSSYAGGVLPSFLVIGVGFGLIFGPSINSATVGVKPQETGVASAMVNTSQQVGGSVGTALLTTLATSATTSYVVAHHIASTNKLGLATATIHGYHVAFLVAMCIFLLGAVVAFTLIPGGQVRSDPQAAPSAAH